MATRPGDEPAAADRERLRAGHADREQVIEALKDAFVQGRLAKDELDARVGQTFASRTYADLAALTADLPAGLAAAGPARPPVPVRRRPLPRAAAGAGGCLTIAAAAVWGAFILDPGPNVPGPPGALSPGLMFVIAFAAVIMAFGVTLNAVVTSWDQKHSRGQLPPRQGPGGHAPDGERHGGPGYGPVPPGPGTGQARADLRAHKQPQRLPARAARRPRGVRPARGVPGIPTPVPRAT